MAVYARLDGMVFPRALEGIRIVDLTRLLPGPMATQWAVDMGAEVIKVEDPALGDPLRHMPPPWLFTRINRGKKSVALDLKSAADREVFLWLAASADVVIEGFRPGVLARLGCGWEVLRERNHRLVYVALTGYGQASPHRARAGHDINYLAMCGVLDLIGVVPGVQIADLAGGAMYAMNGLLAALLQRNRTGLGCFVDANMFEGSARLLPFAVAQLANAGESRLSGRYACYGIYTAADGRQIAVGALESKFWEALCRGIGCEDLIPLQFAEDPQRTAVRRRLESVFATATAEEWFARLGATDACVTPVRTVAEALPEIEHLFAGEGRAPTLGEHTPEFRGQATQPPNSAFDG